MTFTALADSRRRDVDQRRQRVVQALQALVHDSSEITISSVARAARVHRSFIHRHPDLRAEVFKAADEPHALWTERSGVVSRRSLEADNPQPAGNQPAARQPHSRSRASPVRIPR
jgi:hypothetical protein